MNKQAAGNKKKFKDRIPSWINFQNLLFLIVILVFLAIVLWSDSLSRYFQQSAASDMDALFTATTLPGTPTPLPDEWMSSAEQTNGIILGAVVIIIAITAGTAVILIRDREK